MTKGPITVTDADFEENVLKIIWLLIRICGLIEAQEAYPCHDIMRV